MKAEAELGIGCRGGNRIEVNLRRRGANISQKAMFGPSVGVFLLKLRSKVQFLIMHGACAPSGPS